MTEDIAQIAEDFRLYCLSHWSDIYLLYAKWFNASAATEFTRLAWYDSIQLLSDDMLPK